MRVQSIFFEVRSGQRKMAAAATAASEQQIGGLKQFSDYNKSDWNCKYTGKILVVVVNVVRASNWEW